MPTAPVNGIQLYYEIHGEGPSTIVFAHGAGGNHLNWFQQVPFFSKRYKCITFDHRRFHLSPDLPDGPGVAAFVDDLAALLDYLEVPETAIVAQSMSGVTGFGFALAHPRRVKALVMSGTIQGIPSSALREATEKLRKQHSDTGRVNTPYPPSFPEREPVLDFLYQEITALNNGYGAEQTRATMPPQRPDTDMEKLTAPVLFLFGTEDTIVPREVRQLAHRLIPGSQFIEVEGAGHSVYYERPHEFNRIVARFLDEVGV